MINIEKKDNVITFKGHAGYDTYGKDIVCAAVSSIVITTINGILKIDENAIKYEDSEDLQIEILKNDEITMKLIENMIDLLKELEQQYPENVGGKYE